MRSDKRFVISYVNKTMKISSHCSERGVQRIRLGEWYTMLYRLSYGLRARRETGRARTCDRGRETKHFSRSLLDDKRGIRPAGLAPAPLPSQGRMQTGYTSAGVEIVISFRYLLGRSDEATAAQTMEKKYPFDATPLSSWREDSRRISRRTFQRLIRHASQGAFEMMEKRSEDSSKVETVSVKKMEAVWVVWWAPEASNLRWVNLTTRRGHRILRTPVSIQRVSRSMSQVARW